MQLGLNLGVDVLATKHAATLGRQAQSPVHRGPAFARVDRGTGEQLAHVLGQPLLGCQIKQQRQRAGVQPLLGKIKQQRAKGTMQAVKTPCIGGKQLGQMAAAQLRGMLHQRLPGGLMRQ